MQPFIQNLKSKLTKSRTLILGLGIVLFIAIMASVLVINRTETERQESEPKRPTFTNYLKPSSEIKVGEYRYVSTCQVMTIDDVASIFGGIEDDTTITEDYYDTSTVPQSSFDQGITTSCRYDLGDREASLEAEQSFEKLETTEPQIILHALGDDKLDDKIKLYEKAVASTNDDELKSHVSVLKKSAEIFKQESLDQAPDTDNFVVPVDRGLFSFNIIHDNVVYKLDYKVRENSADEYGLSDEEIKENLNKTRLAIKLIKERAQNDDLDQSPAPTILGDTEFVGKTKVIEPCALLTAQLYQAVIGQAPNNEVGRRTVYNNIAKDRIARGDGKPLSPSSSCERNGKFGDTSSAVRLNMRHNKSADELQAALDQGYKFDQTDDKRLQTKADWAGYFNASNSKSALCVFRVGPYSLDVNVLRTSSAGLFSDIKQEGGSEQQCVQLINSIADSVKEYSK